MSEKKTLKEAISALADLLEELGQKVSERGARFGLEVSSPVLDSSAGWRIYVEVSDAIDAYGVIRLMGGNIASDYFGEYERRWFSEGIYKGVPMRVSWEKYLGDEGKTEDRREVSRAELALEEIQKELMAASVSIGRGLGACSLALQEVER